jgi:hypothetical protein
MDWAQNLENIAYHRGCVKLFICSLQPIWSRPGGKSGHPRIRTAIVLYPSIQDAGMRLLLLHGCPNLVTSKLPTRPSSATMDNTQLACGRSSATLNGYVVDGVRHICARGPLMGAKGRFRPLKNRSMEISASCACANGPPIAATSRIDSVKSVASAASTVPLHGCLVRATRMY